MFALILSLPALFKQSEKESFNFNVSWDDLTQRVHGLNFADNISVDGTCLRLDENSLVLEGRILTKFLSPCDRCLKETTVELDLPFEAHYLRGNDSPLSRNAEQDEDDDEESYFFQGDSIDLSDMVQDEILLNLPNQVLCKESCKGLCPICGIDRNESICKCQELAKDEEKDSPLKALEALIIDDEEV